MLTFLSLVPALATLVFCAVAACMKPTHNGRVCHVVDTFGEVT